MASTILPINAREVAGTMTIRVKVRGMRQTRSRFRIAIALLHIAGWISPSPIDVSID